jgi:hypothetical protein
VKDIYSAGVLTMDGIYGAPIGFPRHVEFQFIVLPKAHFRQFIVFHFGVQFLREVEESDQPLFLPIVMYAHKWVVCFYMLT